jgi:hypothetical protein
MTHCRLLPTYHGTCTRASGPPAPAHAAPLHADCPCAPRVPAASPELLPPPRDTFRLPVAAHIVYVMHTGRLRPHTATHCRAPLPTTPAEPSPFPHTRRCPAGAPLLLLPSSYRGTGTPTRTAVATVPAYASRFTHYCHQAALYRPRNEHRHCCSRSEPHADLPTALPTYGYHMHAHFE